MGDALVVGSGPAGVAAAVALVRRGVRVTMVDVGLTGDGRRTLPATRFGRKLTFGSDHPYRPAPGWDLADNDTAVVPSHARGGLSTVWGATMLPFAADDVADWPVDAGRLAAGYEEVAGFVPVAAGIDGLARLHPLHGPSGPPLRLASSMQAVHDRLTAQERWLARHGVTFGRARLAVRTGRPAPELGCSYCNRCLTGCPSDHIFDASHVLRDLLASERFAYRPGLFVERVEETAVGVRLRCRDVATDEREVLEAERVFLGAGPVGTTALLQRSSLVPRTLELLDSAVLVVPLALAGIVGRDEPGYTLSQIFLRIDHPRAGHRPVQAQLYAGDPTMVERARTLHPALRVAGPVLATAVRAVGVAFVYLHSDLSARIRVTTPVGSDATSLLALPVPAARAAARSALRWTARALAPTGVVPLAPLAHAGAAGQGFHVGGALPMRVDPGPGESDLSGRPHGLERVHVVDGTVFPTVPAGPVTYSVMANAVRIAHGVVAAERGHRVPT